MLMPNLTIFIQELVDRSRLGISTAMLQSTRMVGGMIGTAVIGSVISHYYIERVRELDISAFGKGNWLSRLEDPQVLVNAQVQSEFIATLQRQGLHGETFILYAREALVWGIHAGLVLSVVMAVIGLLWLLRLPAFEFAHRRSNVESGKPDRSQSESAVESKGQAQA